MDSSPFTEADLRELLRLALDKKERARHYDADEYGRQHEMARNLRALLLGRATR